MVVSSMPRLAGLVEEWTMTFWGEYASIVYHALPRSCGELIAWQADTHTPGLVRPMRAVLWWAGVRVFGCEPEPYVIFNIAMTCLAILGIVFTVRRLGFPMYPHVFLVGLGMALTYAKSFLLLPFLGSAVGLALGYWGLWFVLRPGWRYAVGLIGLTLAVLIHETLLPLLIVPVLVTGVLKRRLPRWPDVGVLAIVGTIYGLVAVWFAQPSPLSGPAHAPIVLWLENTFRVVFSVLTGGLPIEVIRGVPWATEPMRLREMLATYSGFFTFYGLFLFGLLILMRGLAAGRLSTVWFCCAWLALGTVPLMLPIASPEVFHLVPVLPALFLLWAEAMDSPLPWRRWFYGLTVASMVMLFVFHVGLSLSLFARDWPMMQRVVTAIQPVFRQAERDGVTVRLLFVPLQIGAHYGMIPTLPPIGPGCLRGTRSGGCLEEPTWWWNPGRPPTPPIVCLRDGAPVYRDVSASWRAHRRLLGHRGAGWMDRQGAREPLVGICPLTLTPDAVVRWVRFEGETMNVKALESCEEAKE